MANANPDFENCFYYNIFTKNIASVNFGPDQPIAGELITISYNVSNLPMPTTHLVYVVAAIVKDERSRDPTISNKVKVDKGLKEISTSLSLRWPSDKDQASSLVVFLLDYKFGIYDCVRFYSRRPL
ncbi:28785_t:CDS:1 [Gigaspora margarita]|uniref:28785_t:CDS:1 n=1 Tax=Gigaspora margarita TaxID=4874 RepID=A0ABN7UF68_GIGMA|nr:28785_t:CDS:1 [Gigaspora margarita]